VGNTYTVNKVGGGASALYLQSLLFHPEAFTFVTADLVDVSKFGAWGARQVMDGQETKMAKVYQYLTGPRFRQRVKAIVERFTEMQKDLERERNTMTRLWAKRGTQITAIMESTAGMYGDLQGIAGETFRGIEGLELNLLEGDAIDQTSPVFCK